MPIYAYRCDACGHAQDVLQKISDPLLTICPACGAGTYKKQLTAAGFQLKGSGWYATDFRNGSQPAPGAVAPKTDGAPATPAPAPTPATDSGSSGGGDAGPAVSASSAGGCGTSCACH